MVALDPVSVCHSSLASVSSLWSLSTVPEAALCKVPIWTIPVAPLAQGLFLLTLRIRPVQISGGVKDILYLIRVGLLWKEERHGD